MPPSCELEIERACTALIVSYARATDRGDGEAAARCFTDDGRLEMPGGRTYVGRTAIARRIAEQPVDQVSRHLLSNVMITVESPARARGELCLTLYRGARDPAAQAVSLDGPYLVGEYTDEYRLTDEGWRIAQRRLVTVFRRAGG